MDLETIKSELEAAKKETLYNEIVQLIETEKTKGVESSRKKNAENQQLRRFKTAFDTLGYTDGDIDEFTTSLLNKKSTNNSDSLSMKSLQTQIDGLKKERDQAVNESKFSTIKTELHKVLNDKIYGADLLIQNLISDEKVDLAGGNIVFKNGDDVQPLDDGIKNILETRKDLVKNTQVPGNNTSKGNGTNPNIQAIMHSGDKKLIESNIANIAKELGIKMN